MNDGYLYKFGGDKPKIPYRKDTHLTLSSHVAPEPFECSIYLTDEDNLESQYQHPLEVARKKPPRERPTDTHRFDLEICIIDEIRIGDKHSAQLVKVQVLGISPNTPKRLKAGTELVAKIYDPLYNDHGDGRHDHYVLADQQYSKEVAVYQRLVDLQGDVIPTFYGGFSVDLHTPFEKATMGRILEITRLPPPVVRRKVRCILMQYINGTAFIHVPRNIPDSTCKAMMKAILDAEAQVYLHNVRLRDFHPRNIILHKDGNKYRAVMIDFADADLSRCSDPRALRFMNFYDGQYISPLLRYDINNTGRDYPGGEYFAPWINFDWQKWLEHTYSGDITNLDSDKLAGMRHTFTNEHENDHDG